MTMIAIKHLDRFPDGTGKERLYYRNRRGENIRIPLRSPVGSPEFWEDYNRAAAGLAADPGEGKAAAKAKDGSLLWLVFRYYKTAEFKQLAPRTQTVRKRLLERFCAIEGSDGVLFGDRGYATLTAKRLRQFRNAIMDRPEAANGFLKALRQVYAMAAEDDLVEANPAAAVKFLKSGNPDGFHQWTIEEIEQFEKHHPVGTPARLAFALLLYTGQRRGDIVRLGRQHLTRDGWLKFRQEKTGEPVEIPVVKPLADIIAAGPTGDLTFLVTAFGKPYTSNGFGNRMRKWCDAAGLRHCSAHGIRKASATAMAEKGCTEHEIMSVTGHRTLNQVDRYTRGVRQKNLARSAMDKMEG